MGRIDAIIPEELESKVRIEVVKRLGGKKGDLQKAVIEALEMWVNRSLVEKLKGQATNMDLAPSERIEASNILGQIGDGATDALLEISSDTKLAPSERIIARNAFKEILDKKNRSFIS